MILSAENISFAWPAQTGSTPTLDSVSAKFESGTVHLICGPSGSGKSTLGMALAGLLAPDSGTVILNSVPITTQLQRIAFTFQFPENIFFEDSVRDELKHWVLGGTNSDLSYFSQLGIDFDAIADKHPFHLSAGFGRMTAIALQMSRQPDVLILDEPTTGLDWMFHGRLINTLRNWLTPTRILIVITHDLSVMQDLGGTVRIVDHGRIVWSGSASELLASSARLEQYGLQ